MTKRLLIVFYKNPILGKVKTRLAKSIGDQAALEIYQELVARTRREVGQVQADIAIYYANHINEADDWNPSYFKKAQSGADLGTRMFNAIRDGFERGYESVCLVGTDIYQLSAKIINEAFEQLDKYDVVLGPAKDGGYYLIGMNELNANIFKLSAWSTSQVLEETLTIVYEEGKSYSLLKPLNDIDIEEDLEGTDLIIPSKNNLNQD